MYSVNSSMFPGLNHPSVVDWNWMLYKFATTRWRWLAMVCMALEVLLELVWMLLDALVITARN
jgi:hypothetical protein